MELIAELSGKQIEYVTMNWRSTRSCGRMDLVLRSHSRWVSGDREGELLEAARQMSVTKEDLKIEDLVGVREALSAVDWTTVF